MVFLSSWSILTPLWCKYSYKEIFCGKNMCMTLLFWLKTIPLIGSSTSAAEKFCMIVASRKILSMIVCCTFLK